MPCYCPMTGYFMRSDPITGKRGITFNRNFSLTGEGFPVPCGQCVGCRLEKARTWAVRMMHEKQTCFSDGYSSSFLTLTYNEERLKDIALEHGRATLVKRDVQLFMKRLRKKTGAGVRFYVSGEYGETYGRPHYHVILFNRDFGDKKFYGKAKRGEPLYTSASVDELWSVDGFNYGRAIIGDVSFDSCCYVARYVVDKVNGPDATLHYAGRDPEFGHGSRRPGIGSEWFKRFGLHAYQHDSVIMNGREMTPPRFYDTRYELVDSARLVELKKRRKLKAKVHSPDNTVDRRRVREVFELKKMATFMKRAM